MDFVSECWYDVVFENRMLKLTGAAFQDFFADVMARCHPGDFVRVRPWGRFGDRKNDGYLTSEKILFQVYGPFDYDMKTTLKKINDDFNEALPYWQPHFASWVFVHNFQGGLPADIHKRLLDLNADHPYLTIADWGSDTLKHKALSFLSEHDLAMLLGPAPSNRTVMSVGFEDLKVVLETIERQQSPVGGDVPPVPPEKLEYNKLSESVEALLTAGMTKARLVEDFFRDWHDPTYGQDIATAFNERYVALKKSKTPPNEIFMKLLDFAGGAQRGTAAHEASVLAVLAHLFETCDIFERPSKEVVE